MKQSLSCVLCGDAKEESGDFTEEICYQKHLSKKHPNILMNYQNSLEYEESVNFLNNKRLAQLAVELFPVDTEIAINEEIIIDSVEFTPTVYIPKYETILQFDDSEHFTDAKKGLHDIDIDIVCKEHQIDIYRFPYYLQISKGTISEIYNRCFDISDHDHEYILKKYKAPHGFVKKYSVLPANFCYVGLCRFVYDMVHHYLPYQDDIEYIFDDIILSLIFRLILEPSHNSAHICSIPYLKKSKEFVDAMIILFEKNNITEELFSF